MSRNGHVFGHKWNNRLSILAHQKQWSTAFVADSYRQ
jgi:hypothetical protein